MAKVLMKGAEVIGAATIAAGCKTFYGYPITPQNEIGEYFSRELPKLEKGVFIQAESEVAAINMVYGAAATGHRVMTSSSSPGIALKQEGITYAAGAELPCVLCSISRGGPGLGGILPSQADYYQATRGGGNGDYSTPVYAPATLQEMADLVQKSFHVADKYRTPVMLLADGLLCQMMEPVDIQPIDFGETFDHSSWQLEGNRNRKPHTVVSMFLQADVLEAHNLKLQAKYNEIKKNETMVEFHNMDNAEVVVVAYGTASRVVVSAIELLKEEGINVGLIRPITLWPFPYSAFDQIPATCKKVLSAELSMGQMIDDVRIGVKGRYEVDFYGRVGGNIFTPEEIVNKVKDMLKEDK